ncbi:protein of unknown function [Methylocaldum szegediense]|uniref:Uncharacterized protein n=1 Tax=Methylocaldum szegediense TaxID=73780 RepID=A0ABM9HVT8_9GAMM|nr:protein of unknown function [Methylocaldum szegediense]
MIVRANQTMARPCGELYESRIAMHFGSAKATTNSRLAIVEKHSQSGIHGQHICIGVVKELTDQGSG